MLWAPDGKRLLVQYRRLDPAVLALLEDPKARERGLVARRITRLFYKLDGYGFLPQDPWHLYWIDVATGRMTPLTQGPYNDVHPAISPDGRWVVFMSNRAPDPDRDPDAVDLWRIPAEGGEPERIPTPFGPKHSPAISPDGQWIAYYGREGRGEWWRNQALWVVPWDGGPARNLTQAHDVHVMVDVINDLIAAWATPRPQWAPDSASLYIPVAQHGRVHVRQVRVADGAMTPVIRRDGAVGYFELDRQGRRLTYFFGSFRDPGQLWMRDLNTGRERRLTRLNSWLRQKDLGRIEEHWVEGPDGYKVHGWILKPPDFDPNRTYPSILEIHGGPHTEYGAAFMHEFYFLAAHGYVVYFTNPRGSRGYGEAHTRAIWGDWGSVDYQDLMAWADFMAQQPYIDPDRMGVTGGSYGGFMTLWIVGHTHRFRAAVAQRVVSNFLSLWGTSDFNWVFQYPMGGQPPWENLDAYWKHSPLAYLHRARTPTLLIHSEKDLRTPIEQGEQAFTVLKYQGVPTELIRFPDEPHGLSRVGRTDRRIARLKHILRWFQRYLNDEEEALGDPSP